MAIPLIFIIVGVFAYFYNSHWTLSFGFDFNYFWPLFLIVIGLLLYLKRDQTKF